MGKQAACAYLFRLLRVTEGQARRKRKRGTDFPSSSENLREREHIPETTSLPSFLSSSLRPQLRDAPLFHNFLESPSSSRQLHSLAIKGAEGGRRAFYKERR